MMIEKRNILIFPLHFFDAYSDFICDCLIAHRRMSSKRDHKIKRFNFIMYELVKQFKKQRKRHRTCTVRNNDQYFFAA